MKDAGSGMKAFLMLLAGSVVLATVTVRAQAPSVAPFAKLEQQVRAQQGGWDGDKSILSAVFDQERRRLGDRFESELLKYIAGDAEKHYWISAFLEEPDYLHGSQPLPHLSLLVMEEGLDLLRDKTDQESLGLSLSLNVIAAVLSQKLGLKGLAISHKAAAERRLVANSDWKAYFPAMSEDEFKIYDAIPSSMKSVRSSLTADKIEDRPKARISGGVLNGRATKLPLPVYPVTSREASGQVIVNVVVDEAGKVIWARAISGHPALQKTSEDAAWKAEFPPMKLEGKPEKVSGVLIYNFVRR